MKKHELRKRILAAIAALTNDYIQSAGLKIENTVINSELFRNAKSVFIYVSMQCEPSTFLLLEKAWNSGKEVYVPKCYPNNEMKAVKVNGWRDLAPGLMGILEPINDTKTVNVSMIDLAVIPCLSASKTGARLGHGAGYYDKFLHGAKVKKICLCFEQFLSDEIPMTEHDIRMDYVITENDNNFIS